MTFVLVPGAGGAAWYWHRVTPLLAPHEVITVDLPGDDPRAGLEAYAERVITAIGARDDVTLVAQSMGAFTAAIVAARVPVRRIVFVNAMIPSPGERPADWWGNVRSSEARIAAAKAGGYPVEFDLETYFLHDVPPEVARAGAAHQRPETEIAFGDVASFERWPDVPLHVIASRDDRFFPLELQERVAREKLGVEVDVIPGGHLVALSQPDALAARLLAYVRAR